MKTFSKDEVFAMAELVEVASLPRKPPVLMQAADMLRAFAKTLGEPVAVPGAIELGVARHKAGEYDCGRIDGWNACREAILSYPTTEKQMKYEALFTEMLDGCPVGLHGTKESVEALERFIAKAKTFVDPANVPDGWKIVPVEPEIEQLKACGTIIEASAARLVYLRMVEAAPHHPTTEKGCE